MVITTTFGDTALLAQPELSSPGPAIQAYLNSITADARAETRSAAEAAVEAEISRELADSGGVLLFPAGDVGRLAAQLRLVLEDEATAEAMGAAARRTVERQFDLRRLLVREVELLRRVAETSIAHGRNSLASQK